MTALDVPKCEKDGDGWVITSPRIGPVRVKDRTLANQIWELATWSYRNGHANALHAVRDALGVE